MAAERRLGLPHAPAPRRRGPRARPGGRRQARVPADGRRSCGRRARQGPGTALERTGLDPALDVRRAVMQVVAASMQVVQDGDPTRISEARRILAESRRSLYRLLAEDDGVPSYSLSRGLIHRSGTPPHGCRVSAGCRRRGYVAGPSTGPATSGSMAIVDRTDQVAATTTGTRPMPAMLDYIRSSPAHATMTMPTRTRVTHAPATSRCASGSGPWWVARAGHGACPRTTRWPCPSCATTPGAHRTDRELGVGHPIPDPRATAYADGSIPDPR